MNREIKFRAWDDSEKVMRHHLAIKDGIIFSIDYERNAEELDAMPLMQFTGLHDKNGKEIYEGDVVSGWYNAKRNHREVKWVKTEDYNGWSETSDHSTCELEVIGNIYENPELLS